MRINQTERILAYGVLVLVGLALICFIAVIVGTTLGAGADDGFSHGIWPAVFFVQYYGLPLAFLLIIALLVSNAVRRSRAAKGETR
ncbi:MAG: multidrug ABC transporter ATPase [Salinibacterium sp.]|nr:multidrug ABC transporter ATPase [Micrococcales bacterium]MCB1280692.1 multidrug ABC transporter ATPase [Salinibacterium sp.]